MSDANETTAKGKAAISLVDVRILSDQGDYKAGEMASLDVDAAAAAVAAGWADDAPAAVAYVKKQISRAKMLAEALAE